MKSVPVYARCRLAHRHVQYKSACTDIPEAVPFASAGNLYRFHVRRLGFRCAERFPVLHPWSGVVRAVSSVSMSSEHTQGHKSTPNQALMKKIPYLPSFEPNTWMEADIIKQASVHK